uniref:T9SS type A sorting domain-containing protein n=1 Tax=Ignavibacterium album TaxID=591197 RepID=A0A832G127_9BACT
MKNRLTILIVFILSLNLSQIIYSQSQPKAWYVYKNATGLNNGTSWQNAWTSFSAINWNSMQDWDTLYISGGQDSIIYNESISVGRSKITITKGVSSGHNGKVIIESPTVGSGVAFTIQNKSYVTVNNLNIRNWGNAFYLMRPTQNIYIKNNNVLAAGGFLTTNSSNDTIPDHQNIWIINNRFETVTNTTNQCEFSFYETKNVYVIGNIIINRNNNPNPHDDFAQGNRGTNHYFINNFFMFAENVTKETNANGLSGISNHGGDWVAINNIFSKNDRQINGNINHFWRPQSNPTSYFRNWAKVVIIGNVSIMWTGRHFVVDYDSAAIIKNNLFWRPGPFYQGETGLYDFIRPDLSDNNPQHPNDYYLIQNNGFFNKYPNTNMNYLGGNTPPALHPSNIFIQHSVNGDPKLAGWYPNTENPLHYQLDNNSPCIDAGQTISGLTIHPDNDPAALNYLGSGKNLVQYFVERDFNGNLRTGTWDIGAFEFGGSQVIQDNDPPEVVSAQIIDSVTVRVVFSEPLEQSSANNPNNYVIDNGVNVNSVQFSGVVATLNTSIHSPGFYNVIVSNVTDTAGNTISAQQNSASYGYNPNPLPELLKFVPGRSNASAVADTAYIPEKTFDGKLYNSGDPTSRWIAQYLPQWVSYDLGNVIMLNKTRIQFYNWQNGRIYNYTIQVSTDSVNWTDVRFNIPSQLAEWTVETFEPTPARFVKIIVLSNNQSDWANVWEVEFYGQLMVSNDDETKNIPTNFVLNQNYPNPFNPSTTISWQSPVSGRHTIKLFDMLGREIETIVDDYFEAGKHSTLYIVNSALPSGVYFYQLRIGDPSTSSGSLSGSGFSTNSGGGQSFVETKKMILLK